jgi:hypothetical protein
MAIDFQNLYQAIRSWAAQQGIQIDEQCLAPGKAGEFDGLRVRMNEQYSGDERCYYLIHALGSIVCWSIDRPKVQKMFADLRDAKKPSDRRVNPARLTRAISAYRAFEIESSEYTVWLLKTLEFSNVIDVYSNFMRADLEAMTEFHKLGQAPVWREYFARWNQEVSTGQRNIRPFRAKRIPVFHAAAIELQEILQEQADDDDQVV